MGVAVSVAVGSRCDDDTSRREKDNHLGEPHFQDCASRYGTW